MLAAKIQIGVEFFGVPRLRAGTERTLLELPAPATLADAIQALAARYRAFGDECLVAGRLRRDYIVNRNGLDFLRSLDTRLADNDQLLIMSADAGG